MATRNIEKTESPQKDFRTEFTEKVVAAIESGQKLPWEKPWVSGMSPSNAVTGKEYNGMNRLILGVHMLDKGYTDPRFVTFKQALALEGGVNKGEKGVQIERWDTKPFWKRTDVEISMGSTPVSVRAADAAGVHLSSGQTVAPESLRVRHEQRTDAGILVKDYSWAQAERTLNLLVGRAYTVFNVEQCHDLKLDPLPAREPVAPEARLLHIQQAMTEQTGLQFADGPAAMYVPGRDTVVTPKPEMFKSLGDYQSTMLHEIGHATGAEKRLNRPTLTEPAKYGSATYAKEELRAELFSAFAAMETGITRTRDTQHQAYLQSWAEALKKDKNEIFRAAADAAKAVDYVKEKELAFEQKVDRIFRALGGVEQESAPQKAPHEMPFAQFAAAAQVQALPENHGRKYEVFMGKESLGFADGDSTEGALRQAHKREVNNALYGNQPGVSDDLRKSMPPKEVLSDYPDLEKKWAGVIYMHDHSEAGLKPLSRSDIEPGLDLVDKQGRMNRVVDVQHKEWATTTTERNLETGALTTMLYKDGTDVIRATTLSIEAVAREKQQQKTLTVDPSTSSKPEPSPIRPDLVTHRGAEFDQAVNSNRITPAHNESRITGKFVGIATDSENGGKLPWLLVQRMGKTLAVGVSPQDLQQLPKDIKIGDSVRVRPYVRTGPGGEIGTQIESLEKRHQIDKSKGVGLDR